MWKTFHKSKTKTEREDAKRREWDSIEVQCPESFSESFFITEPFQPRSYFKANKLRVVWKTFRKKKKKKKREQEDTCTRRRGRDSIEVQYPEAFFFITEPCQPRSDCRVRSSHEQTTPWQRRMTLMTLWALPEMGGSKTALSRLSDLAADRPESSGQLKMISPILARWRWAYLGQSHKTVHRLH